MRHSLVVLALCYFIVGIGLLIQLPGVRGLNKEPRPEVLMKVGGPFATVSQFVWIDQARGDGLVTIQLRGHSFSSKTWGFEWIVKGEATAPKHGTFQSPIYNQITELRLELRNLNPDLNQMLFVRLYPVGENGKKMTLAIPTHPEQTPEFQELQDLQAQQGLLGGMALKKARAPAAAFSGIKF